VFAWGLVGESRGKNCCELAAGEDFCATGGCSSINVVWPSPEMLDLSNLNCGQPGDWLQQAGNFRQCSAAECRSCSRCPKGIFRYNQRLCRQGIIGII
jgi:hypothetical protein